MDWLSFFRELFTARAEQLGIILDAAGGREGWLQGEFVLAGRELGLRTNAGRRKFDLRCGDPPMVAELKICGGNYYPKMKGSSKATSRSSSSMHRPTSRSI